MHPTLPEFTRLLRLPPTKSEENTMFIKEIRLENFGPIEHQRFPLSDNKINVIFGDNAMGKTQLLAAVYSVFFFGSKLL